MNPIPASSMHRATCAASRSRRTPSTSSTSAEPALDDSARFPCLATGSPAPATTKAAVVEMLAVPVPSPPVPHVSTSPVAFGRTGTALSRIVRAKPATSSGVSPFWRKATRNAAITVAGTSPVTISFSASLASSTVRSERASTLSSASRTAMTERLSPVRAHDREGEPAASFDVCRTHDIDRVPGVVVTALQLARPQPRRVHALT